MSIGAVGYGNGAFAAEQATRKTASTDELFKEAVARYKEANQLTARQLKEEKDWREMSDDEWEKMLQGVDEYIEAFKERLEQLEKLQEEAAQKAAREASPDKRATAAAAAALQAAMTGSGDNVPHEKNWTRKLATDDQTVLRTAQAAQDMEKMAMSKLQEVQLTDDTKTGISRTEDGMENASVEEDENQEKVWTITSFGPDGIISQRCQNGKILDRWEIKYTKQEDAKKVWDFLATFEKDKELEFAGSRQFWERFLAENPEQSVMNTPFY